jgi:hypothetical protein
LQKIITLRFLKLIQKQRTCPTKVSSKRKRTKIHQLFYPKKLPSSHNKNRNFNRKKMLYNYSVPSTTEIPKKQPKRKTTERQGKKKGINKSNRWRERERASERDPNQTARPNPPPHLRGRERESV